MHGTARTGARRPRQCSCPPAGGISSRTDGVETRRAALGCRGGFRRGPLRGPGTPTRTTLPAANGRNRRNRLRPGAVGHLASLTALGSAAALVVLAAAGPPTSAAGQAPSDLEWVRVPAGGFEMGCVESDPGCLDMERPRHPVRFPVPFEMMATETTVAQYSRFVRDTGHRPPAPPGFEQTGRHPVVLVSWDDAAAFCAWAGARLPTEAEWEYAARAGRPGLVYGWGDAISHDRANYGADQCCAGATGGADVWLNTAPVGSFPPNDFGLFDMAGNVWEWVDGWLDDYATSPPVDPPGAAAGYARIARGGSWLNFPAALRTSVRLPFAQSGQTSNVGFRCARGVGAAAAE